MDGNIIKLDIAATERSDSGELRYKLAENDNTGVLSDATCWGIDGFYSRPSDPDERGACQALLAYEGNNRRVIATKDNRITGKYAELEPGDRAVVTDGNARFLLRKADDSLSWVTSEDGGDTVLMQLTPTAWTLMMPGAIGAMIQMKHDRIVMSVNQGGSLIIDKAGVHIGGPLTECNTGLVTLGMLAPSTPLVQGVNSVCMGPTGMAAVGSTKVLCAP